MTVCAVFLPLSALYLHTSLSGDVTKGWFTTLSGKWSRGFGLCRFWRGRRWLSVWIFSVCPSTPPHFRLPSPAGLGARRALLDPRLPDHHAPPPTPAAVEGRTPKCLAVAPSAGYSGLPFVRGARSVQERAHVFLISKQICPDKDPALVTEETFTALITIQQAAVMYRWPVTKSPLLLAVIICSAAEDGTSWLHPTRSHNRSHVWAPAVLKRWQNWR